MSKDCKILQEPFENVMILRAYSEDYKTLQDDYYKVSDIASELLVCLERCNQGKKVVSLEKFIKSCVD